MNRRILVIVAALAGACGPSADPSRHVCDGTSGIKFAFSVRSPPQRVYPGQQVMWDNGSSFLYIDGNCNYWALPGAANNEEVWADTKTGHLSSDDETALMHDLAYQSWGSLYGLYLGSISDGDALVFNDGVHSIECAGGCGGAPGAVGQMRDLAPGWAHRLWERGSSVSGPVRIFVTSVASISAGIETTAWPLASDVDAIAVEEGLAMSNGYGQGILVSDPSDADTLRAVRSAYRSGQHGPFFYNFLPMKDRAGNPRLLYMRDTMPFEDPHGIVQLPD